MKGVNAWTILGYVAAEPTVHDTQSGKVVKFSVKVPDFYSKNGNRVEAHTWVQVEMWGDLCGGVDKISKDKPIYIEGRYKQNIWNDGKSKESVMNVKRFTMVS